jgi:hypothetical protein
MEPWFPQNVGSEQNVAGRSPRATHSILEVRHAIPHQLDGNRENQEAKNPVDCSYGTGPEAPH